MSMRISTVVLCVMFGASLWIAVHAADPADKILPNVKEIYLDTNGCTPQFTEELHDADYRLASSKEAADAIFKIDVHQLDASMGASARWAASLQRHDGYELFGQSGREDSIDQEELCEDISEDVVEALEERSEAIP